MPLAPPQLPVEDELFVVFRDSPGCVIGKRVPMTVGGEQLSGLLLVRDNAAGS